jgi:hypothetical protein
MPNIEVILLRFNLDKDDDRRLFKALKTRTSSGKRNDYIKKLLLDRLLRSRDEGRNPKAQADMGKDDQALPDNDIGNPEPQEDSHINTEAAGIVSQFLQ